MPKRWPVMEKSLGGEYRLLFLSWDDTIRSPIAKALWDKRANGKITAYSAGIHAGQKVHHLAHHVMSEIGISLAGFEPRVTKEVAGIGFDLVITLSERAQALCPKWTGSPTVSWLFENPMEVAALHGARLKAFRQLRDDLDNRIQQLLNSSLERMIEQAIHLATTTEQNENDAN